MTRKIDVRDEEVIHEIHTLIKMCGVEPGTFAADLTRQMVQTCLRLMIEEHDIAQLKLISRALNEMRHAYRIFNRYPEARCISIFGSARTPKEHPDYKTAKSFSTMMAKIGWMSITGAADGIMKAGLEGAQRESSFGLSIRLPWEDPVNSVLKGDDKLMMFRYFFTRKLMFLSHADAIAAFPGGYGTLDELFEVLTLLQTGKTSIVPVILLEGKNGSYWKGWEAYVHNHLTKTGWISPFDKNLYYIAKTPADAKKHILKFYKRYHSSRYVEDLLVIRIKKPLTQNQIRILNEEFLELVASGDITQGPALPEETDHVDFPRIIFHHTRKNFGVLRALIDKINNFK